MKIRKATKKEILNSLLIAEELKEWFTKEAVTNMKADFNINNLIVAIEGKKTFGFLCYSSNNGAMKIIWLGVKKSLQRKGVGRELLNWLVEESKKLKLKTIEVETLPDEDDYEPYKLTRNFYYKNGFKRIEYKKARIKGYDDQIVLEKSLINQSSNPNQDV